MKFMQKLAAMMQGRNGNDRLNRLIVFIACIIAVINIFVQSVYIYAAYLILLMICIMRMMSKNLEARRKENTAYLNFLKKFRLIKNKIRDRKTHVFKKCPKCKSVLRLPKKKGAHRVVCPKCHERFDVII